MNTGKDRLKILFGLLGAIILLLLILIKVFRFFETDYISNFIIGIAPSLLGPAGLLFLILSSKSKYLNLSLTQLSIIISSMAIGIEFAQLLPRPGFLKYIHYTFDWLDIISSLASVIIAYLVAKILIKIYTSNKNIK